MTTYATIAQAQTYFDGKLNTDAWDLASDTDRTKALTQGTHIIDNLNFHTDHIYTDDPQGSTVPAAFQYANAEIALALLDGIDPDMEYETLSMTSRGYGSVRSTYDRSNPPEHILAGVPSVTAWRYLRPYLVDPTLVHLNRVS